MSQYGAEGEIITSLPPQSLHINSRLTHFTTFFNTHASAPTKYELGPSQRGGGFLVLYMFFVLILILSLILKESGLYKYRTLPTDRALSLNVALI